MSKERELLIRAVEWLHELKYVWVDSRDSGDLILLELIADINKIEQLLAQSEQAEQITFKDYADKITHLENSVELLAGLLDAKKREPLTSKLISLGNNCHEYFIKGIRFAEKMHGIGEEYD